MDKMPAQSSLTENHCTSVEANIGHAKSAACRSALQKELSVEIERLKNKTNNEILPLESEKSIAPDMPSHITIYRRLRDMRVKKLGF